MPSSVTLIERKTTSTSPTSISFTSIPQTYQDLRLVVSTRISTTTAGDYCGIRFNGDTGSNYDTFRWFGTSNSAGVLTSTYGHIGNVGGGSSTNTYAFSMSEVDILSYSNTSIRKAWLYENGMADNDTDLAYFMGIGRWASTAAITQIDILAGTSSGTFNNGCTFSLWGISI